VKTTLDSIKNNSLKKRYINTLDFVKKHIPIKSKILDLGTVNTLSNVLIEEGYKVNNTNGEDLDSDYHLYTKDNSDCITSFEIFEHMLAPYNILKNTKIKKLIASVPLRLWFANAYWNEQDDWDKHYHEFEPKQFNFLLKQTGWNIVDSEKWVSYDNKIGIRPFLRRFTYRYYIVYCER
tara:strand:- start:2544 stop:3080 length:537 start_codon:yes stop_codon:yes gene_type:complete